VENKELRTFSESLPVRRPGDFIHPVGADAHLTEEEVGVQDLMVAVAEAVVAVQDPAVVVEVLQGQAGTDRKKYYSKYMKGLVCYQAFSFQSGKIRILQ